jgi:hypothetical protein
MNYVDSDDASVQANNLLRSAVVHGIALVPEVGTILSGIVGALWEEQADVWQSIRARVEQVVEAKISDFEFNKMLQSLDGLYDQISEYQEVIKTHVPERIYSRWEIVYHSMIQMEPEFLEEHMSHQIKVLIAPLLAKFGTVYLCHLLDAIKHGPEFGMTPEDIDRYKKLYNVKTDKWHTHFEKVYHEQVKTIKGKYNYPPGPKSWGGIGFPDAIDKTTPLNKYIEFHNLYVHNVFCYVDLWNFMNIDNTDQSPVMTYEIYTNLFGAFGSWSAHAAPDLPFAPSPVERITKLNIYSGDCVNGLELFYGDRSTGRQGAPGGRASTMELPIGVHIDNIRVAWHGYEGTMDQGSSFINYMFLASGLEQREWGSKSRSSNAKDVRYPGMCVSSITAPVVGSYMEVVLIFGMRYSNGYADPHGGNRPEMNILRTLYRAIANKEAFLDELEKRWHMRSEVEKAIREEGWNKFKWGTRKPRQSLSE